MTKTIKKLTMVTLLITMFSTFAYGCGNEKPGDKETDAPTTTKVVETTTEKEVTTQEPTTEEPTTEYVMKGESFIVDASLKDYFMDLTIQKGDKISLNELIGKDDGDEYDRGTLGDKIMSALYFKNHYEKYMEFVYTYEVVGSTGYSIPYDENVVIEYNEDEKIYFHFVKDGKTTVLFDVYEVE